MPKQSLSGCHILIVEDEYLLAEDLGCALTEAGAIVAGMVSSVRDALEVIEDKGRLDAAILDVNLGGQPVFPVADRLSERDIPFLFTTGYEASGIPSRFTEIPRCEKPFDSANIVRSLERTMKLNQAD